MQFTFLLDDVGIPKNYRTMDGFGVHTYKLINRAGKETYVKFHWKTKQGACFSALNAVLCCRQLLPMASVLPGHFCCCIFSQFTWFLMLVLNR